jgi:IS5 family transposase
MLKRSVGQDGPNANAARAWKDRQWYFGMKLHVGVDSRLKLTHSLLTTAANMHDGTVLGGLLHGDQAYRGRQEG